MKKTLIVALMVISSIANASSDCYAGAYAFANTINNMHKLGYSRSSIESKFKDLGMPPNMVQIGNRYSSLLYQSEPKGGWANGEYEKFANSFASGACR